MFIFEYQLVDMKTQRNVLSFIDPPETESSEDDMIRLYPDLETQDKPTTKETSQKRIHLLLSA